MGMRRRYSYTKFHDQIDDNPFESGGVHPRKGQLYGGMGTAPGSVVSTHGLKVSEQAFTNIALL